MKTIRGLIAATIIASISASSGYYAGLKTSRSSKEWTPKIGDRVQTHYRPDGSAGPPFITTITNVVSGGLRFQSGVIVYGDGLPGVDGYWVKPAP